MVEYDINQEPLVVSKSIIDLFLKQDNPIDLIALYSFYYYTAKWQKTNQCKCTDTYARNGLSMPRKRFMEAKKFLLENNLIEKIQHRTKKDGKVSISGWYIKVNFMWSKDKVNKVISMYDEKPCRSPQVNKYSGEQVQPETTNALSVNNLNASSDNNENALNNDKNVFEFDNWRKDFTVYQKYTESGFKDAMSDKQFVNDLTELFDTVDIMKTVRNAYKTYWMTEDGWKQKKKKRSKKIDFKETIRNILRLGYNSVYKGKPSYTQQNMFQDEHRPESKILNSSRG